MKCPKCSGRELKTITDQVTFQKTWIAFGELGEIADIEDTKYLADGEWWIDPSAETTCEACGFEAQATAFQEPSDSVLVAVGLDHELYLAARSSPEPAARELVEALLLRRGRGDLVDRARAARSQPAAQMGGA
jgi:hypothetical protein